jgi:response regulator RpfG family c-di-GMP phosphodiesterase
MPEAQPAPKALPVVMLVDDEPLLLESLGEELKESCRLYTATSAADAELRLAARRYDVIVCDHMLPGEQGLDFLMRVMEMVPSTRRILMTGYTNPEFISRSTNLAGLSACLIKPLRASDIAAAVRAALAK